jgi:cardiolipin synthase
LIILAREILVSGLREFLADLRVGVPVSRLAKWKTGIQMVAIGGLLLGIHGPLHLRYDLLGSLTLWVAGILTLITGYDYLQAALRHMVPVAEPVVTAPDFPSPPEIARIERQAAGGAR